MRCPKCEIILARALKHLLKSRRRIGWAIMELSFPITADALGKHFGASVIGDGAEEVFAVAPLDQARQGTLSFYMNRRYSHCLSHLKRVVLFTTKDLVQPELSLTYLVVDQPQEAFATVAKIFATKIPWRGISPQAIVHRSAEIHSEAVIAPFATISEGARIGRETVIYPYVYIGSEVRIGERCRIFPSVTLLDRVVIGNRVKIFPGSVIGSEGFGLFESASLGDLQEMPQVGTVVVEDDVRIGALCTIDRATLGETRIGQGTKLDDHVHVGHNCRVGKHAILCAQVALGGSAVLGEKVIFGGQAAVADHVVVGDGVRLGAQTGASTNLEAGGTYFMTPAIPLKEALRIIRYQRKLPEIWERLKRIEEKLEK